MRKLNDFYGLLKQNGWGGVIYFVTQSMKILLINPPHPAIGSRIPREHLPPLGLLALGGPLKAGDAEAYLKQAKKKYAKLRKATELFLDIQPVISSHTNFQMAAASLKTAVDEIGQLLA